MQERLGGFEGDPWSLFLPWERGFDLWKVLEDMESSHSFFARNGQIDRENLPDGIGQGWTVESHPAVLVGESGDSPQVYQWSIGKGIEITEDVMANLPL